MAGKNKTATDSVHTMDLATYTQLCDVMNELAFRGPKEEALMMRVAKAGNIAKVMAEIKRRRIYLKKHTAGDEPEEKTGTELATTRGTRKKRGSRTRRKSATGAAGNSASGKGLDDGVSTGQGAS